MSELPTMLSFKGLPIKSGDELVYSGLRDQFKGLPCRFLWHSKINLGDVITVEFPTNPPALITEAAGAFDWPEAKYQKMREGALKRMETKQVGGTHYAAKYQHWDWVAEIGLPYFEACATKYLMRWREKNGIQDLQKASHFMQKVRELYDSTERRRTWKHSQIAFHRMLEEFKAAGHAIHEPEWRIMEAIACWNTRAEIVTILFNIETLIDGARE